MSDIFSLYGISYIRDGKRFITPDYVRFLVQNDLLVNPTEGGLALGPSHQDGGIQMIIKHGDEYTWMHEMEGFEYLVNPLGTERYHKRLKKINEAEFPNGSIFPDYPIAEGIRIIDCRPVMVDGYPLTKWIGMTDYGQWIINKVATKNNLQKINEMNIRSWNDVYAPETLWTRIKRRITDL